MIGRSPRATRSWSEWLTRGLLLMVVAATGYVAVTASLGYALRNEQPELAYALAPYDGRIAASLASEIEIKSGASPADHARAARLALAALRADPTAAAAAATVGLDRQLRGDTPAARTIFDYAERMSRRDLTTQIWSIEDSVSRGNITSALHHYDIALRTTEGAPELLFPTLADAIADRAIRTALVPKLAHASDWGPHFLSYLATTRGDPLAVAALFVELNHAHIRVGASAEAGVIDRMVGLAQVEQAWRYYSTLHPGSDPRRSRDPSFRADPAQATIFDWRTIDQGAAAAVFQLGDPEGTIDLSAAEPSGGPLVSQAQMLPPGVYRLSGSSSGIEQPFSDRPYWRIACREGRELARITLTATKQGGRSFSDTFAVPDDCRMQTLTLITRASTRQAQAVARIARAQIDPVNAQ